MTQMHHIPEGGFYDPSYGSDYAPSRGSFTADQIKESDRYELSEGVPIYCAPASVRHALHNAMGASVLGSDPDVEWSWMPDSS
uniref:Uncharacterized protein n=1 Tax=Candidatus Kentrum sp. MB TaxID=2138164 RepID=A0A450XTI1_9GAMM|nr:MAG: hypothetical protein BECKMB1821G_GA0114241_11176 [Candidatus Kentron sp. MB]VFK35384.1 MAG: hypothetical protein BECKMB1821I_GA0114274_11154 [Candidatus Kentron sp. MB]VFK77270.1 MAG: hypothetical protein BECKMB1821H_GA0114242_11174 [Candidatus Kentron sp. MB]